MSKQDAHNEAVRIAIAELANIDFAKRAELLELPLPVNNEINLRVFGKDMVFNTDFELINREDRRPAKPEERILLLQDRKSVV